MVGGGVVLVLAAPLSLVWEREDLRVQGGGISPEPRTRNDVGDGPVWSIVRPAFSARYSLCRSSTTLVAGQQASQQRS